MRAITYDQYGDPDNLTLSDLPEPGRPGGGADPRAQRSGQPVDWKLAAGASTPCDDGLPSHPGLGRLRRRRAGRPRHPRVPAGRRGLAYARKDFVQGNLRRLRHRARARRGAQALALDWDQSAGLPLAGLTAYQLLSRLGLAKGETVLMCTPPPAVGLLAVQIARATGARVIGTASEANHEVLRGFGVELESPTARASLTGCASSPPTAWTSSSTSSAGCSTPPWRC